VFYLNSSSSYPALIFYSWPISFKGDSNNLQNLTTKLHTGLKWILIFLMALMVIDVAWQVFSRYVLQQSSSLTEELATFLLIWVGLLGSAYAYREKAHLGIDLISTKLNIRQRLFAELIVLTIIIIISITVFIFGGLRLVYISPAMQINMGYIYSVVPLTGILFILYSIGFIQNNIQNLAKND
jgi:TRAP-type C4-dicarboxylate transport system permease small subunit